MRFFIAALLCALSYAQTGFSVTIYIPSLSFAETHQNAISSAIQTAFNLTQITVSNFSQISSLNNKALVIFVFESLEAEIQSEIEPLSSSQRIARSSEELDDLDVIVTDVTISASTSSEDSGCEKDWFWKCEIEEWPDWGVDHWLELSLIGVALIIYCCVLAMVCSRCCGTTLPPPPHGPPPPQRHKNPYRTTTVPKTGTKPTPHQTAPAKAPVEPTKEEGYVKIFENKLQPALQHELEMEEFRRKEADFFQDDGEEILGEIEAGDRVEIWSKSTQSWTRAEVLGYKEGKVTVTYEVQGITYRKKVRANDEAAIRFRNSDWE